MNICLCLFLQLFVNCLKLILTGVTFYLIQKSFIFNFHTVWEPVKGFHIALREPSAGLSVLKRKTSLTEDIQLAVNV